jgi:hypothetical protein
MSIIKLLFVFSPWIAFWIIAAGGHSLLWLRIGICVAAAMVIVMGITKLHRGVILWAGVVFFSFALVSVVWLTNMWVIKHMGILTSGTLFLATFYSMLIGQPFTEDYARDHVPPELWDHPNFIRSCYIVTTAWGFVFFANILVNVAKLYYPDFGELVYTGAELAILAAGIVFTNVYSKRAERKRAALANPQV